MICFDFVFGGTVLWRLCVHCIYVCVCLFKAPPGFRKHHMLWLSKWQNHTACIFLTEHQSKRKCAYVWCKETAVAHFVCLTPAPAAETLKWEQQGDSNCHLQDVCLHLRLFRFTRWGVVCVYHKRNQNKRMRRKKTKIIKRKWEVNNKWSRQSFPLERVDSWMR